MASREILAILRAARAHHADAQLILGKHYLFGTAELPKNLATALYWLDRAASQGVSEAWMLIGAHIPFDEVAQVRRDSNVHLWYRRAFERGVVPAGLVLAKLVLADEHGEWDEATRRHACHALARTAEAGVPEAQWLLAQQVERRGAAAFAGPLLQASVPAALGRGEPSHLAWAELAAVNGVAQAQRLLAGEAWTRQDWDTFLRWSLPVARALVDKPSTPGRTDDGQLLSRCARALLERDDFHADEVERFLEAAARAGDPEGQYHLGLWFAKMDASGKHVALNPRVVNRKKAVHWLTAAGQQGYPDAWYAIARMCAKSRLTQGGAEDAARYLRHAADAGHVEAQWELGERLWRGGATSHANDVQAIYWLHQAAMHGHACAHALLMKVASYAAPAAWAERARRALPAATSPFLVARIELAAIFGLSQPEALLLDLGCADQGHCLVVDIRAHFVRSRRRLILVRSGDERRTLTRVVRVFANVDCGMVGPEGNYRQRRYRLQSAIAQPATDGAYRGAARDASGMSMAP